MKLKVKIEFVDKYTSELHKVGDVIDVNEARGNELLADTRKLVTLVKSPKKRTVKK